MTAQKAINNIQNTLDGTIESAIKASAELQKLPAVLRGFESFGIQGKAQLTNSDDVGNYVTQLNNLSKSGQNAANSLVKLDSSMKGVFKQMQTDLQNGTALNAQLYKQQLATTSVAEAQRNLILTESGLVDAKGHYVVVGTQQAKTNIQASATFNQLTSSEQKEVIAAIGDTTAKQAQTVATNSLTVAQKALNVAMGIGKQVLLGVAAGIAMNLLEKFVKSIDDTVHAYERMKEKAQELTTAHEEAEQKVTELSEKIAEVKQKMDECRDSNTGEIVDPRSLELLDQQYTKLKTNYDLAVKTAQSVAKDANQAVYDQFDKQATTFVNPFTHGGVIAEKENSTETLQRLESEYRDYQKVIDDTTNNIAQARQKLDDGIITEDQYEQTKTNGENTIAEFEKMRDTVGSSITDLAGDLQTMQSQLEQNGDDGTQKYQDTVNAIDDALFSAQKFLAFYEDGVPYMTQATDEFSSAVEVGSEKAKALADAIASGNVERGSDAYEYAAELAEKYGVSVEGLVDRLKDLYNAQQDASDSTPSWDVDTTQELADFMSKLSDSSSDLYAKTKALTSAYNDMYQSQKLSSDSIQSLISAYPDLINQMETENGVTTISKDILCEKFDAMKGAMVATIESEIQATQTAINEANARIATYQAEIKALTTLYSAIGNIASGMQSSMASGSYQMYDNMPEDVRNAAQRYIELNSAMADANKTLEDATAKLADQKKALEVLNNLTLPNYAGATKGASSGSKGAAKAAKEHKKALEEQKKEAEKTQKALEKYSKTLKAQGDAVIDILDKRKDALEKEQKAKDKAWDKEKEQLQDEKDLKDKAWDKEKEQLKEEKELQDDIYDKQKKALKEQKDLQDKVYQKQIDDLKDKKQALQDANDEEDRAIKLAQLQDALEQAKSQRTKRVYQHDTGFEWQTDESAVSDAQNALDDQQRAWRREDAIAAVEKEIEAVEKLKDAYDEQIEAEIDGIDKAKDAYDEKVEAQIDAIEKAKDAFDEMIEDRIDQIEKAKDAYDEMIEGETEKLDEMKEKWQDVMDLIGMSWEDYQAKIAATAQFQNMTLDGMGQYLGGYKDEVIKNMQDIAAAEAEVQKITDELSGLDTSSSSGGGGGGGGGGTGIGTGASVASGFKGLSDNLKEAASKMQGSITELQNLKDQEEALKNQIDDGNLTTSERIDIMTQLGGVQAEIKDKENDLNDMSANYIITLGEESDATDEYRSNAIEYLQMLNTEYGANYEEILQKLNQHVQDLQKTNTSTSQEYDSMGKTVEEFANSAGTWIDNLSGNFDSLAEHVKSAASDIVSACASAKQELENLNKAQAGAGSSAIGSRSIQRAGYYHIDESGPEIVVHDGKPGSGRYTYMERGGEILPASFSKNLWDMGSNPGEWFERQYSKFNRMDNSKATYAGSSTVYSPTFTGDIVISNPIANSDDLARGLKQNLPASFMQAVGVRM